MSIAKTTRPYLLTREAAAARIEALEAALRGIIQTLESLNDTKRASFYRGSVVNELTMALDLARAALANTHDTPPA